MRRPTRNGHFILGGALIAFGVLATLASYGSSGGTYVVWYGAILVGVVRLFRGLMTPESDASDQRVPARPDDPRWGAGSTTAHDPRWGGSRGRQIVGASCAACGSRIGIATEGTACGVCDAIVHRRECEARHLAQAHAAPQGAYRDPAAPR